MRVKRKNEEGGKDNNVHFPHKEEEEEVEKKMRSKRIKGKTRRETK